MKFEKFEGKNGDHYFRLVDKSGNNILRSEGYTTKSARDNGISSVMKNGVDASRYVHKETAGGKYTFNIKAGNGQVVATSTVIDDENSLKEIMKMVQKQVAKAKIVDA